MPGLSLRPRSVLARVRGRLGRSGAERDGLAALWGLAVLGLGLGLALPPSAGAPGPAGQLLDLVRLAGTTALAIVLLLGPGLAVRALRPHRPIALGFLPLPGAGLLALTGGAAWAIGLLGWVHPRIVSVLILVPALAALALILRRPALDSRLSPEEWRVLLMIGAALGLAIARALWSAGPAGELYGGTIYRTLEVGDRPDSRIPFHLVQLIGNGNSPFGPVASSYFAPYTFSSRGPLPGLLSAPIVLLSGGRPPAVIGSPPWTPFDPQGFMAYRLIMMTLACTSLLSLWTLTRRVAGSRAARVAVLLAVTTPFVIHELWFTWPKLAAASLVLLAAVALLDGRRLAAGLLVGVGYLMHPLALLSIPALLLLALWPLRAPHWRRPQLRSAALLLIGIAASLVFWRVVNGSHYTQGGFLNYVTQAGSTNTLNGLPVTVGNWLSDRLISLGNTLLPLRLFLFSGQDQEVNAVQACFPHCHGGSPGIEHFFFQYWNTVPFGFAIVFFPVLLASLWRAWRTWPWPVTVGLGVPFAVFAVYWGGASTGLLREGLHAWVLTVLAVIAAEQAHRGFPLFLNPLTRGLLALRSGEVLLMAVLPTLATTHVLIAAQYPVTDVVSVLGMGALSASLGLAVWRLLASARHDRHQS